MTLSKYVESITNFVNSKFNSSMNNLYFVKIGNGTDTKLLKRGSYYFEYYGKWDYTNPAYIKIAALDVDIELILNDKLNSSEYSIGNSSFTLTHDELVTVSIDGKEMKFVAVRTE